MAASVLLEEPFFSLQASLGKKATFESACCQLASQERVPQPVLARARTLLRSRFTGRPFWVAGRQLFRSALEEAQRRGDTGLCTDLQSYIQECDEYLGEAAGTSDAAETASSGVSHIENVTSAIYSGVPPPAAPGGFLFEGQMSGEGEGAARPRPQPRLFDLLGAFAEQLAAAAPAQLGGVEEVLFEMSFGPADPEQNVEEDAAEQGSEQQQQQSQQQPTSHGLQQQAAELPPHVREAIERELDAIAVQLMEQTGQEAAQRAPPASKKVVASLPKELLTAARLEELGGEGTRCPVCMEDLSEGDEVQVMPCGNSHIFHPPCLAPWLENNNSCPNCRHELPTDDQKYENRKERERVEEGDRRGAANAVSHQDFLYI